MDIPVDDDIAQIVKEKVVLSARAPNRYSTLEILCWALWAENSSAMYARSIKMEYALQWIEEHGEWIDDSNSD